MGNTRLFDFFIFNETPYMKFILQSSDAPENYGFTRSVDLAPIDSVQEFIKYLQIKIFDLECKVNHYEEVSDGNKDDEDDDTSNVVSSQDEPCTIPYCTQEEGPCASGTTTYTTCNGWILRRRLNVVCYVGVRLLGLP